MPDESDPAKPRVPMDSKKTLPLALRGIKSPQMNTTRKRLFLNCGASNKQCPIHPYQLPSQAKPVVVPRPFRA